MNMGVRDELSEVKQHVALLHTQVMSLTDKVRELGGNPPPLPTVGGLEAPTDTRLPTGRGEET